MDTFLTLIVVVEGVAILALALVVAHLVVLVRDGQGVGRTPLVGIVARTGSVPTMPAAISHAARAAGVSSVVFLKENCESCMSVAAELPSSDLGDRVVVAIDGQLEAGLHQRLDESEIVVVSDCGDAFASLGVMLTPLLATFDHTDQIVATQPLAAHIVSPASKGP